MESRSVSLFENRKRYVFLVRQLFFSFMYVPQDASHFLFSPVPVATKLFLGFVARCIRAFLCFFPSLSSFFFSIVTLYILEVFTGFLPGFTIVAGRCLRFVPTFCSFNTIPRLCNVYNL